MQPANIMITSEEALKLVDAAGIGHAGKPTEAPLVQGLQCFIRVAVFQHGCPAGAVRDDVCRGCASVACDPLCLLALCVPGIT